MEVLTLAFAVVNAAIYAMWWNKPQGVDMVICVPLKREEEEVVESAAQTHVIREEKHEPATMALPEPVHLPHLDQHDSRGRGDPPMISLHKQQPDEHTSKKHNWLHRSVQDDREQPMPVFLFRLPFRIVGSLLRPLGKMTSEDAIIEIREDVPARADVLRGEHWSLGHTATFVYLWHHIRRRPPPCVGSEFPSRRDQVLWRAAAVVLTVAPVLPLSQFLMLVAGIPQKSKPIMICLGLLYMVMTPLYIAARFVVVFVAVKAIQGPPSDVLLDDSWTARLPHF